MRMLACWTILLLSVSGSGALIPDQFASFMHILYSSLPVIKKGTDSRVGFGFRFGPLADAQVLLELGPQKATRELTVISTTPQPDDGDLVGKRQVWNVGDDDPFLKEHATSDFRDGPEDNHILGRSLQDRGSREGGGDWLSRWRAAWGAAAPSPTPSSRSGRGLRIALAPAGVAAASATATSRTSPPQSRGGSISDAASSHPGPTPRPPRANPPPATSPQTTRMMTAPSRSPMTPSLPALHLRNTMAQLSRTPSTPRPTTRPTPYPLRQGLLRILRQLWAANS